MAGQQDLMWPAGMPPELQHQGAEVLDLITRMAISPDDKEFLSLAVQALLSRYGEDRSDGGAPVGSPTKLS